MDERIRTHSEFEPGAGLPAEPAGISIAPWHGIEQCLASVIMGSVYGLGGPPTAILIHYLQETGFRGINRVEVGALGVAGGLGGLFVILVSVVGLTFGIGGMNAARQQRRSTALGLVGVLFNGFNVLMWVLLLICWIAAVVGHR